VYKDAIAHTKRPPLPNCCWKIPVKCGLGVAGMIIFSEFIAAAAVGHVGGIIVSLFSILTFVATAILVRHLYRHPEVTPQEHTPLRYTKKFPAYLNTTTSSKVLLHGVVPFFTVYCALLLVIRLTSTSAPDWQQFPSACPSSLSDGCTRLGPPQNRCSGCVMPCSTRPGILSLASHWMDSMCDGRTTLVAESGAHDLEHWQILSSGLGFYDDMVIYSRLEGNNTVLWVQSQQRLGWKDSGVNDDRVRALTEYLNVQLQFAGTSCKA